MNKDTKKNKDSILLIPILKIKVADNPLLHFKAFEPIKIPLIAECHNITIPKQGLKYQWIYSDSTGFTKTYSTNKGSIMLSCPNAFCGRTIKVKVLVIIPFHFNNFLDFTDQDNVKNQIKPLHDTIELHPICEKKIADTPIWEPDISEMPDWVIASLDISGYNGKEVGIRQFIMNKGKVVWQKYDKKYVIDNSIQVEFCRMNCPANAKEDKMYTLWFQIVDTKSGNQIKQYHKIYSVKQIPTIEAINGFPLQPVLVGNVDIQENNYMPCKYTQIDVEYTRDEAGKEKKKITIFKEGQPTKNNICIIGGKRQFTITLLEYTPEKCTLKSEIHRNKKVISVQSQGKKQPDLTISKSGTKGKTNDIEIIYNYGHTITDLEHPTQTDLSNLLKYFLWPINENIIQKYQLNIATCRHSKNIFISQYPDIEWGIEFVFKIAESNPIIRNNLSSGTYKESAEQAQKAGYDLYHSKKYGKSLANFGLTLDAKISDKKIRYSLSANYEKRISLFVDTMLKTKEVADKVLNKVKDGNSRLPFLFEIEYPKMVASLKWCAADRPNNNVGIKGLIDFKADPLVGANFSIDLLKFGSRAFPIVGFVVDLVNSSGGTEGGTLSYEGRLELLLIFSGSLGIDMTQIEFYSNPFEISASNPKLTGKFAVKIELRIGVSLGIKTFKFESKVKISANASIEAGFSGNLKLGIDNKGVKMTPNLQFDGMTAKLIFVAEFAFKTKWIKETNIEAGKEYIFEETLWDETPPLNLDPFYLISID